MLKGFKQFVLRGNVVDLAIAVVIGVAFGAVVTALVKDIVTPLIAAIVGQPDFSTLHFTIHHSRFLYGDLVNALVSFISIAAAVYFFVVAPLNALSARRARGQLPADEIPVASNQEVLLMEIRDLLAQSNSTPGATPGPPVT
ncbi:MAG: large conductance mechanosensitive channel protein MscL [Acidimicrobiales bacterium]